MKSRIVSVLAAATFAIMMLGCSSARVESPAPNLRVAAPPRIQSFQLPPLPQQNFKACRLGRSCMAMDDRPFELCLVSRKRCADKIKEPILVDLPNDIPQPPNSSITGSRGR
jgi:hypothetical protein